jgi:predicted esterase YcpF (UPF0227 family)
MARILFLHGLHGSPQGTKVQLLCSAGHDVCAPSLPKESIAQSLLIAETAFLEFDPKIVVGSSRGGALALSMSNAPITPMVLLAPAWVLYAPFPRLNDSTILLHSRDDEVIPFHESERLLRSHGLPPENLRAVGSEHSLNDQEVAEALLDAVSASD